MVSQMSKKRYLFSIVFILIAAFLIRFYDLENNPHGFFTDEAALGYNAYKILTTGKDEHNKILPLFFESYGDYRLPIPIYSNILTTALFGLNERSVRLTAVLFGMISILFVLLSTSEIIDKKTGLLAGLLIAIMPWNIHFSRWGAESIYFPALFSIGLYLYLKSFKRRVFLILATVFFGLAMYTYYPAIIVTPVFMAYCFIEFYIRNRKSKKLLFYSLITFFILCLPLVISFTAGNLQTRWNNVINKTLNPTEKIRRSALSYINHFSPDFLFTKGDSGSSGHYISRHSVIGFGELHIFYFPLLLIGLYICLTGYKNPKILSLFVLLLLYPIGSSITSDGPFATRSIIGMIPFSIIPAIGFNKLLNFIFSVGEKYLRLLAVSFIAGIVFISVYFYLLAFFIDYPKYSSDYWGWQYGFRQAMDYFKTQENNYDDLLITHRFNSGEGLLNFYNVGYKCIKCRLMNNPPIIDVSKKQLYALRQADLDENIIRDYPDFKINLKKTINLPNGNPELFLVEFSR